MNILSPCEAINGKLDSLLTQFNVNSNLVNSAVYGLNDTLNAMKSEVGITDLQDQINAGRNTAFGGLNDTINKSGNFFGSCLDGVTDSLYSIMNDSSGYVSSVFNDISGISNLSGLLGGIANVKSVLDGLGIPKLLEKIDSLLGCLADNNDCIPTDKIQTVMTTINNFLETNGLGETGEFDINNLLNNIPDMNELIKENISMISTSVDEISEEAKSTVLASTKKARSYYDKNLW